MKKIGIALKALAVLAAAGIGFAGCSTADDKPLDLLEPGWFCSSQGYLPIAYTETDVATGTVEFTFSADNDEWGDASRVENGILEFGVCTDKNWSTKYIGATDLTVGGGFANCKQGDGANNKATGLEAGKNYVITVRGTADTISVKIDEAD
ncbi:hypothetical protein [Treponema saccharophilum]|uniref:Lipoprotein n=1 Tax=Treponema saccharophilum DSM 2985 TaxID=907348 RepID=H7EJ93_9SPIR|nr:hypothetical protein [Treponema saccharophilum]EIC02407.1 hypothetical protein TresaDRAFT_1854 [Treponema saccharophilum DSM 2985]BDC97444.1 hypothetical protein TRSA_25430 [Treponema saccharophilum]